MTLDTAHSKAIYHGNGTATVFPFAFKVWNTAQVLVTRSLPGQEGEADVTAQSTITLAENGGTVTYLYAGAPLPSGATLAITRNMPFTHGVDLVSGSQFDPQVIEDALDQATSERQQVKEMLGRAVILPSTSDETPQEVVQDIYTARDEAEAAAAAASASENAAAASATKSAAQALLAEESRGQACQCADRAEQARDVAMQQAEAVNVVMATEMGKINAVIAVNKYDQAAAITASRAWSETDEDIPVDTDHEGNPEYSSKHWAMKSSQLLAGNASTTHKGVMQVGKGLEADNGLVAVKLAQNGGLIMNSAGGIEVVAPSLIGAVLPFNVADGYVPNGCVLPDGAEYTGSQFPTFYADYLAAGRIVTCTYAEFAAQVAATGNCAKFALDADNHKFKVPLLKDGDSITHAANAAEIGKSVKAGLPDLQGTLGLRLAGAEMTGVFSLTDNTSGGLLGTLAGGDSSNHPKPLYKASSYNSIFGNSNTVTDEQVRLRHFVVLASAQNNASMFDWSAYMAALAGKLNTDMSNLDTAHVNAVLQQVRLQTADQMSVTTPYMPTGSSPTNTQGMQVMTKSITARHPNSVLVVDVLCNVGSSPAGRPAVALFHNSDTQAVAVCDSYNTGNEMWGMPVRFILPSGGLTHTFSVRIGSTDGTTTYLNRTNAAYHLGATSTLVITEYAV